MDPPRYRKAYAAMLHATQLIEQKLSPNVHLESKSPEHGGPVASLPEQDPDTMDWTPTGESLTPAECGPPTALSDKLRPFLQTGEDGEVKAPEKSESGVLLQRLKEGVIMNECIESLVRDLPDVLSNKSGTFTPSTIEVPKDFGLQMSISINHHLAQVADHKALEKYRRLLGYRKDASKRRPIKLGFDPVELIKKQAVTFGESPVAPMCTLDGEIHQIFRQENWHGCPDSIYNVLKPALRLATLFLTSQATAHFWHTLIFGKREQCAETSEAYGQPCFRIRENVLWSEERHAVYKNFLENQVDTVHFYFHRDPLPEPDSAYASMGLIKDYKTGLMRNLKKCHKSRICLHSDFYTTAKKLSLIRYKEPAMVLRFNLFLASCLSHEMAHFCEVSGPHHSHPLLSQPEVFWGDNTWTESGIAFETRVFGGRVHPLACRIDCSLGLACLDYPLKELYDKDDNVLYSLPMDYVHKLQQQETWEQDFNKVGSDIFFVPRTGGRSLEINGANLMIWEDENEVDISDHIDDKETEWKRMDDGSISKNPNSGNRKPQRQPFVQRWSPYGHKRKKTSDAEPCVSKEVAEVKNEASSELEDGVQAPGTEAKEAAVETRAEGKTGTTSPEASEAGKGGSDQDMV